MAGPKTPGKTKGEICWHGRQAGRVQLADRQLKVERPRPLSKRGEEVAVPAYEALRGSEQTGAEMFEALLKGLSTRNSTFCPTRRTSQRPMRSAGYG